MVQLRLDSWDVDYGASAALVDESWEDVQAAVDPDLDVETSSVPGVTWEEPIGGRLAEAIGRVGFVDGARHVEARLRAEEEGRSAPAIAGSWAVGAIFTGPGAHLGPLRVGRELIAADGIQPPTLVVPVGDASLSFRGQAVPSADPDAPGNALQRTMRDEEATLARELLSSSPAGELLVLDGTLAFVTNEPVLGLIKRQHRMYLPPEHEGRLAALPLAARTPVFRITYGANGAQGARRQRRWSWYLRIAHRRPADSHLVGIVRLELPDAVPLEDARGIAARAAEVLPLLASDPLRDPRAPQNLYPVGELERQLHRRLGHGELVRARLRQHIERLVAASASGAGVPA